MVNLLLQKASTKLCQARGLLGFSPGQSSVGLHAPPELAAVVLQARTCTKAAFCFLGKSSHADTKCGWSKGAAVLMVCADVQNCFLGLSPKKLFACSLTCSTDLCLHSQILPRTDSLWLDPEKLHGILHLLITFGVITPLCVEKALLKPAFISDLTGA